MGMLSSILIALLSLSQLHIATCFVEFFEPSEDDICKYESSNTYELTGISASGGVCAYNSDSDECYFCPPDQPKCWMWEITCGGNSYGTEAGPDQVLCHNNGTEWCCSNVDDCLTETNQNNVCNPKWANPLNGISTASAIVLAAESSIPPTRAVQSTTVQSFSAPFLISTASSSLLSTSSSMSSSKASSKTSFISSTATTSISASTLGASGTQSSPSAMTSHSGGDPLRFDDRINGLMVAAIVVIVFQQYISR